MNKSMKSKDSGVDWIGVVIYGLGAVFYGSLATLVFRGVFHLGKTGSIKVFAVVTILIYLFLVKTDNEDDNIVYPGDSCGLD